MLYSAYNGAMQTTSSPTKVTTGAAIKTLMQIKPLVPCRIVEWGISFDGSAAATPGVVELIQTDVAATVTAFVANDLTKMDAEARQFGDPTSNLISVGVSSSGFTASAEGTTTAVQNLDMPQLIAPTNEFIKQFPLGREPYIEANKFARIRVNFGSAINALCYMVLAF
jgi:hypothetical protein